MTRQPRRPRAAHTKADIDTVRLILADYEETLPIDVAVEAIAPAILTRELTRLIEGRRGDLETRVRRLAELTTTTTDTAGEQNR